MAGMVAGKLTDSSKDYEKASAAMGTISDHFEVYSVAFLNEEGEAVTLSGNVELLFRADDYFDRTKVEIYYMDESGSLTKLSSSGYGRFVVAQTDKTGIFIVCIPGVSFHMPMWGYALILAGALAIVAIVVVTIIVMAKRKKKISAYER